MSDAGQVDDLTQVAANLNKLAEFALDTAKNLGADAAKISTGASFQKRLVVDNKEFTLANSLASRSIGIVVHKDQKKGWRQSISRRKTALNMQSKVRSP